MKSSSGKLVNLTNFLCQAQRSVKDELNLLRNIWQPHPGQAEFLGSAAKIKVLACGRRWGKTDACAAEIVLALLREHPEKHLILAPTLDQSRILFDRVVALLEAIGMAPAVKGTPYPTLTLGQHRLTARSGHVGRSLRGGEATAIVVDEAAFLPESLINEVAMPMLATTEGTLTLISTPNGMNHFWRFFEMGQAGENGVWSRRAPSSENPRVSETFLAIQRRLISERAFAVEYEAAFLDSENSIFRTEALDDMVALELVLPPEPVCIGIDWGRYRDFTAVAVLCGSRASAEVLEIHRFNGLSYGEQVRRVAAIIARHNEAYILCDATGVGDPVVEQLQAEVKGFYVGGYVFTPSSKVRLIENLAMMVDQRCLRMLADPTLRREMQAYLANDQGKLGGKPGFHDDLVTALALATYQLPAAAASYLSASREAA